MPKDPVDRKFIIQSLELLQVVVSKKVKLGWGLYGLCPFHEEKTPSFNIFKAKSGRARFHCFGCQEDGDVFNYLQKAHNMNFKEATEYLEKLLDREIMTPVDSPISSSLRASANPMTYDEFCERDCDKYARLREDYDLLLAENERLRDALGLPEFQPFNETKGETQ